MYVTIHLKRKDGTRTKTIKEYTVKQAKEIMKEYFKDENITDVFTTYFDGWHSRLHKEYKKEGKILNQKRR